MPPSVGIAEYRGRSAMHLAASAGDLHILKLLLQSEPLCLDPAYYVDPALGGPVPAPCRLGE